MEQQESPATAEGLSADTPNAGHDAGEYSKRRFDGLNSVLGKRTQERDEARAELERLRAAVIAGPVVDDESTGDGITGQSQSQGSEDVGDDDTDSDSMATGEVESAFEQRDPMLPPEPPVIVMAVNPSRGQSIPLDGPPPGGTASHIEVMRSQFAKQAAVEHQRLVESVRNGS